MEFKICLLLLCLYLTKINCLSIEEAEKTITEVVAHLADEVLSSGKQVGQISKDLTAKAEADIKLAVDEIKTEITSIKNNVCSRKIEESLKEIIANSHRDFVYCGPTKLNKVAIVTRNVKNQIQTGIWDINDAIEDVNGCNPLAEREACLLKTTTALGVKTNAAIVAINAKVAAAVTVIASLKVAMEGCFADKLAEALLKVGANGVEAAKCAP